MVFLVVFVSCFFNPKNQTMKAEKIAYSGVYRIKISFEFDEDIIKKVKSIQGALWSSTLQSWHIPYTREAFTMLKKLFPAVEYNSAFISQPTFV